MTSTATSLPMFNRLTTSSVRLLLLLLRGRAILVLILLVILFSLLAPSFLTTNNLAILTKHVAIAAMLAIGMTFVVLTGGIDLSVGSIAGLGGMVAGLLLTRGIVFGGSSHYPSVTVSVIL